MLGIILTGHGGFASGMEKAMKQILGEQSRQHIGRPSRRKRHNETSRPRRVSPVGMGRGKHRREGGCHRHGGEQRDQNLATPGHPVFSNQGTERATGYGRT